jgi:PAS domain S-box-containing protein
MVEDITAKKTTEEANFRHAAIVESSEDAIASVTLDGVIVGWNPGAQRIFGYTEAEAVGKSVTILVPPELPDEENKILETLRAGGRINQFETVRVSKTGKRINVSLSISPIKDSTGKTIGCSGIARDITERKRAEEALRASEERMRLAQQVARIGTFEWNIRTGVNTWTTELEALYGLPSGSFAGTQAAFENLVHPDDRARVTELADGSFRTGQPTRGEWRITWPDGSVHWIAGNWQVLMDGSGEPLRMIGVNVDVTERKLAEDKLREYERAVEGVEEMIVVVDREYRCLMANRGFLKRRNLMAEQVVGRFVHEFVIKEVYDGLVKPKLDECFRGRVVRFELKYTYPYLGERDLFASYYPVEGSNGVDRAACILHDITDRKRAEQALADMPRKLIQAQEQERARIGRELHDDISQRLALLAVGLGQLQENPSALQSCLPELRNDTMEISTEVLALSHDLHPSKLEYLGVAAGIKSWCKEFAQRRGMEIEFETDVSSVLPAEIGVCLFRVLQEALHNAVKYSGVKHIEVRLEENLHEVHLLVSDQGRGFDLESVVHSRGLGLISMRERVRLVNGTIAIESKPMRGTTIHVRVPLGSERDSLPKAV